jgi:hypothetical protein
MTKDEALQMCLEYIETNAHERRYVRWAINEALVQPAQEPVAYLCKPNQHGLFAPPTPDKACKDCFPVYTAPPQPAQVPDWKDQYEKQKRRAEMWIAKYEKDIGLLERAKPMQEQPAQEPVAWRTFDGEGGYDYRAYDMNEHYAEEWNKRNPNHKGWVEALYTTPPQRHWVGLTDDEIDQGLLRSNHAMQTAGAWRDGVEWATKQLKEKNT